MSVIIDVGKILLDVPNLLKMKTHVKSPDVNIANTPWYLHVYYSNLVKSLRVYACCDGASKGPEWSCDATVIFKLLAQKAGQKTLSNTLASTFTAKDYYSMWHQVKNPLNGFNLNEDGGIVLEATIAVTKVSSENNSPLCDFAVSTPNVTDVVLLIDEKKLHVSKQYLALYSPVFNSMFFSDFAEKDKKEVTLKEVDYDDFVELLHAIYPSRKPVTADTVEGLLHVADLYNVSVVLRACEDFLKGPESKEIPLVEKLLLSDQYSLATLEYVCFNELKTIDDIKLLVGKKEYRELTDKTKAALVERILELC